MVKVEICYSFKYRLRANESIRPFSEVWNTFVFHLLSLRVVCSASFFESVGQKKAILIILNSVQGFPGVLRNMWGWSLAVKCLYRLDKKFRATTCRTFVEKVGVTLDQKLCTRALYKRQKKSLGLLTKTDINQVLSRLSRSIVEYWPSKGDYSQTELDKNSHTQNDKYGSDEFQHVAWLPFADGIKIHYEGNHCCYKPVNANKKGFY